MHRQNTQLTDDQKTQALEIISQYNPENMTEEDKSAMRAELRDAGIKPSRGLKEIIEGEGFEVEGPKGSRPPHGSKGGQRGERIENSQITEFLEKYDAGEITDEDIDSLVQLLKKGGQDPLGVVLDQTV